MKKSIYTFWMVLGTFLTMQAQTRTSNVTDTQKNQMVRINEGMHNGELTKGKIKHLFSLDKGY
jgi:hypothetical protein